MRSKLTSLLLLFVALAFGVVACDSGGGMDSEPDSDPEPGDVEATVEGSVTDAESGDPISGADVSVLQVDADEQLGQAITGDEGSYELSFTVPEDDTPDQLAIEVEAEGFMAKTDTASFNQSLTQDVALEVVATEVTASGAVTDEESGEGIEGAAVAGSGPDGNVLFEDTTGAGGEYQKDFEVAEEPEEVTITAEAEDFESGQQTVGFSEQITADFQLASATMEATASGTVTNRDTGDPVEGATITGSSGSGDMLFEATTDANGEYQKAFGIADEPSEVMITAEAEDFESGQQTVNFSEQITADFQLDPAMTEATVSGTITRKDTGDPIEGATLDGTRAGTEEQLFQTETDADGQYKETFEVKATNEPSELTIEANAEDFDSASQTLAFSEDVTANFELASRTTQASASGSVARSDTGDPIEGTTIVGAAAGTGDELFKTTTDADGQYSTTFEVKDPDQPGEVTIEASAEDFESASQTLAFSKELTADLELGPKEVSVTVSGTVSAEMDGSAVEGADVSAFRTGQDEALDATTSGSGGSYELSFTVLAPDAPEEIRLKAKESRFDERSLTVGFGGSITQDIELPSIEISTIEELQAIQTDSDFPPDGYYVQTSDIDASETASWNSGTGFKPIGDDVISFSGSYDGNDFAIEELTIQRPDEDHVGLFGLLSEEGQLRNIVLTDSETGAGNFVAGLAGLNNGTIRNSRVSGQINGGEEYIGGVAGKNDSKGLIQNSSFYGSVICQKPEGTFVSTQSNCGGLVGENWGTIENSEAGGSVVGVNDNVGGLVGNNGSGAAIKNSKATGDVEGRDVNVGGLVGSNSGTVIITFGQQTRIENSGATGNVEGDSRNVGGLVGENNGANIRSSYATGDVLGRKGWVGGLVGLNQNSTVGEADGIRSSFATGNVSSKSNNVGGLVGVNQAKVFLSYAKGVVSGDNESVGGLIGSNEEDAEVDESYSSGPVSGAEDVGGLIGTNGANVSVSFWDTEATGQDAGVGRGDSDGATGLTTDEMQGGSAEQKMDGFNFEETWQTVMGDYPALFWEDI